MTVGSLQVADACVDRPPAPAPAAGPRWNAATRVAFRFSFVYFTLYVASTQMLGGLIVLPKVNIPSIGTLPPLRNLTERVAAHLFHARLPLVVTGSGSGDKTFDFVQAFCLLAVAIAATVVWSIVDRRRQHYQTLQTWFTLFLRFSVAATMAGYGAVKVIPLQMPAPQLTRLVEPFGNFSPMGVLWYSVGASFPYEIFTGCVEVLSSALLFVPRTAIAGALVALAATTQIFVLNMTYDVPVKLFSFHLIVMSLVLMAPDASRLANLLLLDRAAGPSTRVPLLRNPRAMRWLAGAQVAFGAYVLAMNFYGGVTRWKTFGGGAPKPSLYGIWNVDEMTVDGQSVPPLLTDAKRWRRVVFQSMTGMSFQLMSSAFVPFAVKIDDTARTVTLTKPADTSWSARFTYERPRSDRLILDGDMDGQKVRLAMHLVERDSFLLVNRGFHWVQEYPFNR